MAKEDQYGSYISPTFFEEEEYENTAEMLVAVYIIVHSDIAGVCPINKRLVASKCKIKQTNLEKILKRFEAIGKAKLSTSGTHIWWKSRTFYALYKGRFSQSQLENVIKVIKRWHNSGMFGEDFAESFVQLYENKYSISIPYPHPRGGAGVQLQPQFQLQPQPPNGNVDNSQTEEPEQPPEPPTEEKGRTDLFNKTDKEKERTDGQDNKNNYQILESEYQSARDYFEKRFGKEILNQDIDRLVFGDPKIEFAGMGNVETLVFAIANYKSKKQPDDPIGLLIDIGKNPDKYFQSDMLKSYHQQGVKPVFPSLKFKNVDHS